MTCENCEQDYDPIRTRWRCPHCGWKASCCEGEPMPAPRSAELVTVVRRFGTECGECARCSEPLIRFPDGPWEHFDGRLDSDHFPEVDPEPLDERQAEAEVELGRIDMPLYSAVEVVEPVAPSKEYL